MEKKTTEKPFSYLEMSAFCGQMAMLLKAGISVSESLELMLSDTAEKSEKSILTRLSQRLTETDSFWQSCEETGLFSGYLVRMIRIGEETGNMDDVLASMEKYYAREADIQKNVRSAVTFPLVMIAMLAAVIVVLLTKVFPVFNQVFLQLGSSMSGLSAVLLNIGNAISRYATGLIIILVFLALLVMHAMFTEKGRQNARKFLGIFPSMKKTIGSLSLCRFTYGMALTLGSGLLPEQSLELSEGLVEDAEFNEKVRAAKENTDKGMDLYDALEKANIFPSTYSRMLRVGAKVGNTDEAMEKISNLCEEEFENRIFGTISVMEPILVVILSVIVGVILLSVMLPLTGIMSGL